MSLKALLTGHVRGLCKYVIRVCFNRIVLHEGFSNKDFDIQGIGSNTENASYASEM